MINNNYTHLKFKLFLKCLLMEFYFIMLTSSVHRVLIVSLILVANYLVYPQSIVVAQTTSEPPQTTSPAAEGKAEPADKAGATETEGENPPAKPPVESDRATIKLSPSVRIIQQSHVIPVIPAELIQHFLNRPQIVTPEEIQNMGYIIGNANRNIFSTTDSKIYVLGLDHTDTGRHYMILMLGQPYQGPADEEPLAYEAVYLGDALLEKAGENEVPSILRITNSQREIEVGARLLPISEGQTAVADFYPHVPEPIEDGYIVGSVDRGSLIGQYQIVVVNKGSNQGLERGHLLSVYKGENMVKDNIGEPQMIALPDRFAGTLLVFKVFEEVSYALIMKSVLPISRLDKVAVP